MTTYPQKLIDLRQALEDARHAWYDHTAAKNASPEGSMDARALVGFDIEDRRLERATCAARHAYDIALKEFTDKAVTP